MTSAAASARADTGPFTPSEIVYLKGDQFAAPKTLLDSFELLTDHKVKGSDLGRQVLLAALLAADARGDVRLAVEPRKAWLGLRTVEKTIARPGGPASFPDGTLEAEARRHVETLAAKKGEVSVEDLVYSLIGTDAREPYLLPIGTVQEGLAKRQLLDAQETRRLKVFRVRTFALPDATRATLDATDPAPVKALLREAEATRPDFWKRLVKDVQRGIDQRYEQSDGHDD